MMWYTGTTMNTSMKRGQYIAVGAILGVGVGFLTGNMTAFAIIGVGLGFVAGLLFVK